LFGFVPWSGAGHNIADLDQAITMLRSLLWQAKLRSEEDPMFSEREKLGQWLTERFNTLGYPGDPDEALEHFTAVAGAADRGVYPARASLFSNAASLLAGSVSSAEQASRAIAWARRALSLSAANSETASYAWASLGRGLRRLHNYDADPALLDEALDCLRRALDSPLPDMYRADLAYPKVAIAPDSEDGEVAFGRVPAALRGDL
jgi:tetratricopeptide (TPR) repeat protein